MNPSGFYVDPIYHHDKTLIDIKTKKRFYKSLDLQNLSYVKG